MSAQNIIEVKNLTKMYSGLSAVNNISFKVKKGEIFAFLGPNGAGKTTTIKMLTTLLKPSGGKMLLNGSNPEKDQNIVRNSFGIVFQDPSLDDELTAYENLKFHAVLYGVDSKLREEKIEELLEFVGLIDRKNNLVKTFSGGMKRRLEIARGFLHKPKILFLDEPTLGLDPQTRKRIWDYIGKLNRDEGVTVFFTTHYMDEAEKNAQKIAIIDNGKIIAEGTAAFLKKKTNKKNLEEAFIELTGRVIREETVSSIDNMRLGMRMWGGGKRR